MLCDKEALSRGSQNCAWCDWEQPRVTGAEWVEAVGNGNGWDREAMGTGHEELCKALNIRIWLLVNEGLVMGPMDRIHFETGFLQLQCGEWSLGGEGRVRGLWAGYCTGPSESWWSIPIFLPRLISVPWNTMNNVLCWGFCGGFTTNHNSLNL